LVDGIVNIKGFIKTIPTRILLKDSRSI